MIDIFNLPNASENTQIFYGDGSTTTWQTWRKPRNSKIISFYLLGGGAGGGGGVAGVGVNRNGGSGGGSSSNTKLTIPAAMIPDVLYINVGAGGVGGASNSSGSNGNLSYVSIQPSTGYTDVIIASGSVAATGGQPASTPGAAGTQFVTTSGVTSIFGLMNAGIGATAGGGGLSGNAGGGATITAPTTGGAGGGGATSSGTNGVGGSVTASGIFPSVAGGSAGSSNNAGASGLLFQLPLSNFSDRYPLFFLGGAGGGANGAGTGGNGGDGAYGCGGGGGGAGVTGGSGGKGGNGLVIITSY